MPHSDGTPTIGEHVAEARRLLEARAYEGDRLAATEEYFLDALRGIGHSLLAVHGELEAIRTNGLPIEATGGGG